MNPKRKLRLFLDASVLIAGSESLSGGSAAIIRACQKGIFKAVVTKLVLIEAERNISQKLGQETLLRFYKNIVNMHLKVQPAVSDAEIAKYAKIIEEKGAHVLASALVSGSDYLITLDRKHFQTEEIMKAGFDIKIATPAQFLQDYFLAVETKGD